MTAFRKSDSRTHIPGFLHLFGISSFDIPQQQSFFSRYRNVSTLASAPLSTVIAARVSRRQIAVPVIATAVMLLGSFALLFARLGHYSLWTDEASTAITAAGVWRTGDTSAWLDDRNLLAYRDGLLLKNQKDRYTSPLQFYLAAPFIGLIGRTALAARLPFAICGFATVCIIIFWLRRAKPPAEVWIAAVIILLGSASFFLFQRQCRYYAPATFLSTLLAYQYCNWNGRRGRLFLTGITMAALLASQYLDYAAVVGCLLVDYGIWGRQRRTIRGVNWLILIAPQLLMFAIVCPIWNPVARAASVVPSAGGSSILHATAGASQPWILDYLKLCWWNLRDMLACDFVILPLLIICPVLYFHRKSRWLLRAPLALLVFIGVIALFTSHPLTPRGNAEVRYLAPVLPLCVGIGILAVWGMRTLPGWVRGTLLGIAASAVWLQGSAMAYFGELAHPAVEPYTPVAAWINQNLPAHSTVYVCPDMCVSPMMWNAPQATYIWQLSDPAKADYRSLPDIYFKGRVAPDCMIAFGSEGDEVRRWLTYFATRGVRYEQVATIPLYAREMFRPELIWRSFTTIVPGAGEEIYVFRKAN